MGTKNVGFEYYRVFARIYNKETNSSGEPILFNIVPLLEKAYSTSIMDRTYKINEEEARLQDIERDALNKKIWKMRFIRIRDSIIPGIASKEGTYDLIELEDDEYIGEEISVLYDETYNIIMLQRNRNSLSPSGVEKYFSSAINDGTQIELRPIPMPETLREIKPSQSFKRVSINFCPTKIDDELLDNSNTPFRKLLKSAREMGAVYASITLSMGNSKQKEKSLNKEAILELKETKNYEGFSKIQINKKECEDTKVETVDLIAGKLTDIVQLEFSRVNLIEYNRVIEIMKNLYYDKLDLFRELFGEVKE